jgi:hypothetical protein
LRYTTTLWMLTVHRVGRCRIAHASRISDDRKVMNALGLIIGGFAIVVVILAFLIAGRKRQPATHDLGPVSERWVARQRALPGDPDR